MKLLTLNQLLTSHLTNYFEEEGGDLTPERVFNALHDLLGEYEGKVTINEEGIVADVMRYWAYNTYEYKLTHSRLQDTPKGLFQSFEKGHVYAEDLERLRDILFEAGKIEESMLVSDKIAEQ